jgi:hypothetical protein
MAWGHLGYLGPLPFSNTLPKSQASLACPAQWLRWITSESGFCTQLSHTHFRRQEPGLAPMCGNCY